MTFKIGNYFSSRNILIVLIFILILTNLVLFYFFINPQIAFYTKIFEFLGSKTFELVTISIGLPILLFFVDYIFKFREKYAEEKKQRKLDSLNLTQELWNDLAKISADFIYMNDFNDKEVAELNKNIDKFKMKAENVANTWFFEFSDLNNIIREDIPFIENNTQLTNLFLTPINILLSGITSIIRNRDLDPKDIKKLQAYVPFISTGIIGFVYRPTINILKGSILLSEIYEEQKKIDIISNIEYLQEFNLKLINKIYGSYPYSSDSDLKEVNDYLVKMKDKNYEYYDSEIFKKEVEALYNKLPNDKKMDLKDNYEFSEDLIKDLANILHIKVLGSIFDDLKEQYIVLKKKPEKDIDYIITHLGN